MEMFISVSVAKPEGSQRYIVAMKSAGVGIFASYATTLVGIIPMGFARLSSIRSLFMAYVISLNVGLFFGLVFIPLVSIYVYGVDLAPRGTQKRQKAEEHEVEGSGARLRRNSKTEKMEQMEQMEQKQKKEKILVEPSEMICWITCQNDMISHNPSLGERMFVSFPWSSHL